MTINDAMLSNAKALTWTYGLYCILKKKMFRGVLDPVARTAEQH